MQSAKSLSRIMRLNQIVGFKDERFRFKPAPVTSRQYAVCIADVVTFYDVWS